MLKKIIKNKNLYTLCKILFYRMRKHCILLSNIHKVREVKLINIYIARATHTTAIPGRQSQFNIILDQVWL